MDVETPPDSDFLADGAAVSALYRILLGRNPENDLVIAEHEGQPLSTVMAFILQSTEFRHIARNLEAGQQLPHSQRLTLGDIGEAAAWAGRLNGAAPQDANWWTMIEIIFARAPVSATAEYQGFAEQIQRRARITAALSPALKRMAVFDAAWYRRANRDAERAIRAGTAVDAESYFLATGRRKGDQLLPGFSVRLPEIYEQLPTDTSIADMIDAILRAANRGISGHWLFSEHYYVQSQLKGGALSRDDIGGNPYVHFLSHLAGTESRPHPLFCPRSYAMLNGVAGEDAAFDHYIRVGMFEGCQTSILFDPSFYADVNPRVGIDVLRGEVRNELHHFLTIGIFDDARFSPYFDADFYLATYPDVAAEVATGIVPSATWHFVHRGLAEGRSPSGAFNAGYYRARYPHVDAELVEMGLGSALEHYLLVGRQRGYGGDVPLIERRASLDDGKVIFQRRALRSLDRQSRSPLHFPVRSDRPIRLSVIIPVCGHAHHTARLIECAHFAANYLAAARDVSAQVIVVDNGSHDETAALLAATTGITTILFPDPIGYPRAIAAGIEAVEGDYVLVVNNDIEFEPDAFLRVIDLLTADATIGVVGGLVMLPNERLQDAGSFVDHDGSTVGVGRHEDPWSAFVRGVREVDYCAGCFFGFRLADYVEIGGVDEQFSPGYYEEVDLAFRMRRQLGKRVVVASDIQVVHLEHGSFGRGLTPVGAEPIIRRNRSLFLAKHATALADRPSPAALLHDYAARPNAIARARALVIVPQMPSVGDAWPMTLLDGLSAEQVPFEILVLGSRADCDVYADRRVNILRGWLPGNDPLDLIRRAAGRFSHIIVVGLDLLRSLGPALGEAVKTANVTLMCDVGALPVLAEISQAERLDGAMPEVQRIALVRAAMMVELEVASWLASTDAECELLMRAGARRAVTVGRSGQAGEGHISIALVGCGCEGGDVVDARNWCRASVSSTAPGARRVAFADILRSDWPEATAVSIGLPAMQERRSDGLTVAVIPPRLNDIGEIRRAIGFGIPVLMKAQHRRRIEEEFGTSPQGLAIVDEASATTTYAAWFARLLAEPSLVDAIVAIQRTWLACGDARPDKIEGPRVVGLR